MTAQICNLWVGVAMVMDVYIYIDIDFLNWADLDFLNWLELKLPKSDLGDSNSCQNQILN
ncbi:unnamed protein product [Camellia sinensis]